MSKGELHMKYVRIRALQSALASALAAHYPETMRQIKLSGREQAVIRAIDYANGSTGDEIRERTNIEPGDLADILQGLCDVGYVESFPPTNPIDLSNCAALRFETNPAYAQELKTALRRS